MEVTNLDFRYRIMSFEAADEVTVEGEREHKDEELFGLSCHEGLKWCRRLTSQDVPFHDLRSFRSCKLDGAEGFTSEDVHRCLQLFARILN